MANEVKNQITQRQLQYLLVVGQAILPCWTLQQDLRPENGPIQPNSGACQGTRYNEGIQPSILKAEDMEKPEGSLLPKACLICPAMAQALARIPDLDSDTSYLLI